MVRYRPTPAPKRQRRKPRKFEPPPVSEEIAMAFLDSLLAELNATIPPPPPPKTKRAHNARAIRIAAAYASRVQRARTVHPARAVSSSAGEAHTAELDNQHHRSVDHQVVSNIAGSEDTSTTSLVLPKLEATGTRSNGMPPPPRSQAEAVCDPRARITAASDQPQPQCRKRRQPSSEGEVEDNADRPQKRLRLDPRPSTDFAAIVSLPYPPNRRHQSNNRTLGRSRNQAAKLKQRQHHDVDRQMEADVVAVVESRAGIAAAHTSEPQNAQNALSQHLSSYAGVMPLPSSSNVEYMDEPRRLVSMESDARQTLHGLAVISLATDTPPDFKSFRSFSINTRQDFHGPTAISLLTGTSVAPSDPLAQDIDFIIDKLKELSLSEPPSKSSVNLTQRQSGSTPVHSTKPIQRCLAKSKCLRKPKPSYIKFHAAVKLGKHRLESDNIVGNSKRPKLFHLLQPSSIPSHAVPSPVLDLPSPGLLQLEELLPQVPNVSPADTRFSSLPDLINLNSEDLICAEPPYSAPCPGIMSADVLEDLRSLENISFIVAAAGLLPEVAKRDEADDVRLSCSSPIDAEPGNEVAADIDSTSKVVKDVAVEIPRKIIMDVKWTPKMVEDCMEWRRALSAVAADNTRRRRAKVKSRLSSAVGAWAAGVAEKSQTSLSPRSSSDKGAVINLVQKPASSVRNAPPPIRLRDQKASLPEQAAALSACPNPRPIGALQRPLNIAAVLQENVSPGALPINEGENSLPSVFSYASRLLFGW